MDADDDLHLRVAAEAASLETARRAVMAHLAPHALSDAAAYAVELVLEEVLSNQIKYAQAGRARLPLALRVAVSAARIELRFEDRGVAFDPLSAPLPPAAGSIEEARVGGLGLGLVRRFTQDARYERVDGVNRLTLSIDR